MEKILSFEIRDIYEANEILELLSKQELFDHAAKLRYEQVRKYIKENFIVESCWETFNERIEGRSDSSLRCPTKGITNVQEGILNYIISNLTLLYPKISKIQKNKFKEI